MSGYYQNNGQTQWWQTQTQNGQNQCPQPQNGQTQARFPNGTVTQAPVQTQWWNGNRTQARFPNGTVTQVPVQTQWWNGNRTQAGDGQQQDRLYFDDVSMGVYIVSDQNCRVTIVRGTQTYQLATDSQGRAQIQTDDQGRPYVALAASGQQNGQNGQQISMQQLRSMLNQGALPINNFRTSAASPGWTWTR